eukprot:1159706-Pelagomonas_calceolata.AAC.8
MDPKDEHNCVRITVSGNLLLPAGPLCVPEPLVHQLRAARHQPVRLHQAQQLLWAQHGPDPALCPPDLGLPAVPQGTVVIQEVQGFRSPIKVLHVNQTEALRPPGVGLPTAPQATPSQTVCLDPMSAVKVIDFGSSCFKDERVYTYIQSRFYRSVALLRNTVQGKLPSHFCDVLHQKQCLVLLHHVPAKHCMPA